MSMSSKGSTENTFIHLANCYFPISFPETRSFHPGNTVTTSMYLPEHSPVAFAFILNVSSHFNSTFYIS